MPYYSKFHSNIRGEIDEIRERSPFSDSFNNIAIEEWLNPAQKIKNQDYKMIWNMYRIKYIRSAFDHDSVQIFVDNIDPISNLLEMTKAMTLNASNKSGTNNCGKGAKALFIVNSLPGYGLWYTRNKEGYENIMVWKNTRFRPERESDIPNIVYYTNCPDDEFTQNLSKFPEEIGISKKSIQKIIHQTTKKIDIDEYTGPISIKLSSNKANNEWFEYLQHDEFWSDSDNFEHVTEGDIGFPFEKTIGIRTHDFFKNEGNKEKMKLYVNNKLVNSNFSFHHPNIKLEYDGFVVIPISRPGHRSIKKIYLKDQFDKVWKFNKEKKSYMETKEEGFPKIRRRLEEGLQFKFIVSSFNDISKDPEIASKHPLFFKGDSKTSLSSWKRIAIQIGDNIIAFQEMDTFLDSKQQNWQGLRASLVFESEENDLWRKICNINSCKACTVISQDFKPYLSNIFRFMHSHLYQLQQSYLKHITENGSSQNWNPNIRLVQKQRHTDSKPGVVYIVQDSVWKNPNYWKIGFMNSKKEVYKTYKRFYIEPNFKAILEVMDKKIMEEHAHKVAEAHYVRPDNSGEFFNLPKKALDKLILHLKKINNDGVEIRDLLDDSSQDDSDENVQSLKNFQCQLFSLNNL